MKKQKGTTKYLNSVDEKIFGGNFLNTKIIDVIDAGYTHIIYGYIVNFNNNWDLWVNCDNKCFIKVGELYTTSKTYSEKTVAEAVNDRVQQQKTDSSPYEHIPVFCFPLKENIGQQYIDKQFRNFLKSNCDCVLGKGENVYGITRSNIKEMYEKYLSGERTLETFKLYDEQRECVNMMLSYYNEHGKYVSIPALPVFFLLAAKCRFGKNFTILKFIEMVGFKNNLFLSYKPEVFKSLKDDITGHKDFKTWNYINNRVERDLSPYDENGKITTVVSTSVQQLIVNMNKNDEDVYVDSERDNIEKSLEDLVNSDVIKAFVGKVDLLVLDEAHFGGHTDYLNKIVDIIKPKMALYVTGTASNFLNDCRFEEGKNVYRYDYSDEREHHPEMPKIEIYSYEMPEYIVNLKEQYDIDERPNMAKLLSNYNTCEDIVLAILGVGKIKSRGDMNFINTMPYRNPDFDPYVMHTFWACSNVDGAKNVVKILKKYAPDEFIIIDSSGEGNGVIKDIDKVKDVIELAKYENKKTITVTVERFREGVNVPKWGSVFRLDDCRSYDKDTQTNFRAQTPCENFWEDMSKDKCLVFEFNPERCLYMRDVYIHEYKNTKYKTTSEWIKRLNETMPLMYYNYCGELKKNDAVHEIMNEFSRKRFEGAKCDNLLDQISSINSNCFNLSDESINKLLEYKNKVKTKGSGNDKYTTNSNGVDGGKTYKKTQMDNNSNDENPNLENSKSKMDNNSNDENLNLENSKSKFVIEILRNIIKRLPRFLMLSGKKYEHFKDVIDDIYQNYDSSILFEDIMKMESIVFIEEVYKNNIIEDNKFKYFIEEFYRQFTDAKTSSNWELFENRWIYLDGEEKDIPFDIVEEIYNF